jgi:trk system potassium uptake protein TrkA
VFVLIAGGGRTASQLARSLVALNHEVHLIEERREVLVRLHQELPTEVIHEGKATDPEVLERAGVVRCQVLACCLPRDSDALALCFLARTRYRVPRIIGCIDDPQDAWLFGKLFHVDVALNQSEILATLIGEEMSLGDMMTLLKLRRGRYSLVEEKIPARARAVGVALRDLPLPPQCVITAIIRHGDIVIPRGDVRLEQGDEILALVDTDKREDLARLLGPPGVREPEPRRT